MLDVPYILGVLDFSPKRKWMYWFQSHDHWKTRLLVHGWRGIDLFNVWGWRTIGWTYGTFLRFFLENVLIFPTLYLGSGTLLCLWWGQVWSHFWRYLVKTHPSKRLSRRWMANQIFHFNWSKSQCQLFVREPEKKEKKF